MKVPLLKEGMYLIAKGLCQQERKANSNNNRFKYSDSPSLKHGLNKLLIFAISNNCFDNTGKIIAPFDETDAVLNYFSKPVSNWMSKWPEEVVNAVKEGYIFSWDNLVEPRYGNKYQPTRFCEEVADVYRIVETELEQERFYNSIKNLDQEEYVALRRFVIENRAITKSLLNNEMRAFIERFEKDSVRNAILAAYEKWSDTANKVYICSYCGWTVTFDRNNEGSCQDKRCKSNTNSFKDIKIINDSPENYYRLKKGVMQFIASPGSIELEIEKTCIDMGLKTLMWPDMDRYDIKIVFGDGEYWAVEAKDYSKAFLLKDKIEQQSVAIPDAGYEKAFVVIPDDRVKNNPDYCKTVNKGIRAVEQKSVKCITFKDLIKRIKKRYGGTYV